MKEHIWLSGFHPIKHALRFAARPSLLATKDKRALLEKAAQYSPDLLPTWHELVQELPAHEYDALTKEAQHSDAIACAARPEYRVEQLFVKEREAPVVVLEHPTHMGNLGACIRAAAAANAHGVLIVGDADPFHPLALRGAQGLQFALPVVNIPSIAAVPAKELIALDPAGDTFAPHAVPGDALLVFGSELRGISPEARIRAQQTYSLPMKKGVSSLNLATSVASALYALYYAR